ncbi:MAG TPA: succinate--CoA ligase subunit alpha [Syntrophorhabdus sp.]|jgi:succinyl-CoA synthetase alpha subunit|nr:succinate--CoA ligase subunit alpha [Syntrophorhabdus sp.]OPX96808.1 MAG: Succinyl-CoA ligase (ADP-forming) subunit alpha [Syntrophorhabdus sp. PtaB.Bin027]NMC95469.1 succinate--CoA ligase subunit alpha [Syntrophorhabdus sp.]HNQ45846.1 succinate--CoA ligase subunit alpha [Syntrophorhabdus sp.]HNY69723.1 succinate--CoA ligase subunit alpha [Syntrophorhabdus sp.]
MSILIDQDTGVVIQGITGGEGAFHTRQMKEYGTKIVAGVTPGKGGQKFDDVPIFNTVREAVENTKANTSGIFVPPAFAADAIMEAVDAGLEIIVCLTEGIPTLDMIAVKQFMKGSNSKLIGPNTPGIISPGKCKVGVMAGYIHTPGRVGVISRSGTLTYEVVDQLTKLSIGQSSCVGIGGDPVIGMTFVETLNLFEKDKDTDIVVIIGEIGGHAEEEAADFFRKNMSKPVVAFIAGVTAPPGRRMGHAGAIVTGGQGGAREKIDILEKAGITVVKNPSEIGETVARVLAVRKSAYRL